MALSVSNTHSKSKSTIYNHFDSEKQVKLTNPFALILKFNYKYTVNV